MTERIVIVLAFAAMVAIGVFVVRQWNAQGVKRLKEAAPAWSSLRLEPDGRRTLIAFSTPSCLACHKAQAPAIDLARERLGDEVRVIRVDAASQPDVARAFGVLTVPTTVVIGRAGRVVAVNHGFAPSGRLVEQLQHA